MSFISLDFIYIFLPIVLICFIYINKKHPKLEVFFLLAVSLFYCGYVDFNAALILVCSISINYTIAYVIRLLGTKRSKLILLTIGVLLNVLTLFWLKFSLETSFGNVQGTTNESNVFLEVGIPLGISFYTFYQISFLVDTYKSKTKLLGFFKYSLSASMFSQLPAGPILNYNDGLTQFGQVGKRAFQWTSLYKGLSLFTLGLMKKVFLADYLSNIVNQLHHSVRMGQELNALETVGATWGFLLQVYFDFSAYSDMAIGLGLCFGFTFPINFNSPLKAKSLSDFILRWHMSLIGFTRTYIFLPVSKIVKNNTKGKAVRRQFIGWVVGLQASYLIINIWHAPTLMLVLHGLILGAFLVVAQVISMRLSNITQMKSSGSLWSPRLKVGLSRIVVLSTASLFTVLLKVRSFQEMNTLLAGFTRLPQFDHDPETGSLFSKLTDLIVSNRLFPSVQEPIELFGANFLIIPILPFLGLLSLIAFILPSTMQIFEFVRMPEGKWYSKLVWKPTMIWGLVIGFTLALYLMLGNESLTRDFMYGGF